MDGSAAGDPGASEVERATMNPGFAVAVDAMASGANATIDNPATAVTEPISADALLITLLIVARIVLPLTISIID